MSEWLLIGVGVALLINFMVLVFMASTLAEINRNAQALELMLGDQLERTQKRLNDIVKALETLDQELLEIRRIGVGITAHQIERGTNR